MTIFGIPIVQRQIQMEPAPDPGIDWGADSHNIDWDSTCNGIDWDA